VQSEHKLSVIIGIPPRTSLLRIERIPAFDNDHGTWHIWTNANEDFTLGTHITLHDNGCVERVTIRADEGDDVWLVKPGDRDAQESTS
jgi:hypothetical protein